LVGTLNIAFRIQRVKATGTIYIRADGSIEGTTKISTVDNVTYTFTGSINNSIVVERSNITIDGNGYTLQPFPSPYPSDEGFQVSFVSNVTIKNTNVKNFGEAVYFNNTSSSRVSGNNINASCGITLNWSSNNTISENNITCNVGITLEVAFNNTVSDNNITCASDLWGCCISLYESQNNKISRNSVTATNETGNRITLNRSGILLAYLSNNNSLIMNNITHCEEGVQLYDSSDNVLRNNTMAENVYNFIVEGGLVNYVDTSNTIDGKPIYYLINKQDLIIPSDAEFVALINCTRMTVQGLTFSSHNKPGMLLAWTKNSTITKNNMTRPGNEIKLYECSNNSIFENNITTGIYLENSLYNEIFENNMTFGDIDLKYSSENTVFGNTITRSECGLDLYSSSKNVLSGNNLSKCKVGIDLFMHCSNNILYGNFIKTSSRDGICLIESSHNLIYENNIEENNQSGILFDAWSSNNTIFENNITNNNIGIRFAVSPNNTFCHNNLINNTQQVDIYVSYGINFWDNGVEGNHWSDYEERYPNATEINGSGIWDTPYVIDKDNQDNYPLVKPIPEFPPVLILLLFMLVTLLAATVYRRKHSTQNASR
ncbi:MAG: right-handed parallel beta-helix repeat-containing protein, partial [Candidatus Bathyarchaeota archaeon]|nr:right-handed parallel beta-helix repeat-containing protein [Candidatus Bathyarchaeota archaeon]